METYVCLGFSLSRFVEKKESLEYKIWLLISLEENIMIDGWFGWRIWEAWTDHFHLRVAMFDMFQQEDKVFFMG